MDCEPSLTLYLPCKFSLATNQYEDNGDNSWVTNPGRSANRYHREFSKKVERNTLSEISNALAVGAKIGCDAGGFHKRNTLVSQVDFLIAFTWSDGDVPKDGGTANTWKKCRSRKLHIPLSSVI